MAELDTVADDLELAQYFVERHPDGTWQDIARLIAEVRTEQRDLDAEICEQYAEDTTFVRKSMGAKECARRIREGVATPKRSKS